MQGNEKRMPEAGSIVAFTNKTGRYAGEVMEINGMRALIKVLAVLKHPDQGDLHNPYNPDVPMFHERRALSYTEKTNVPFGDIEPFHGEVPEYKASLARAVAAEIEALDRLKRWTERGLDNLRQLEKEYGA
ncbi:kinase-associated lipoprotein B [Paenibacillus glycinis]|uniref:Kinase n=1 Tax=Paenibacillus glycinis TaxID=2697035 RepID=A0ABW9XLW5_9BACL|nr:kinase-associated lipoprotein B [Paenibacillus glycinis]NBD23625.1 kinase [Paenibacillus glycinis]